MLDSLKLVHDILWSSPLMMGLCAFSIGYLLYREWKYKESKALVACFWYFGLTAVLVCMNPILSKLLAHFSNDGYTFVRFTWLLPIFPLTAYALTLLILELPRKRRVVALAVVAGLILCAGEPWPTAIIKQENIYKITDSLKDACDAIATDCSDERPLVTVYIPDNNIYVDGSDANMRYFGVRQYAPQFILDYCTITPEQYKAKGFSYEGNLLNYGQYVICDRNENLYREVSRIGYELLKETKDLAVFKNTVQATIYLVRHGQTEANVEEQIIGVYESPLTEKGIRQAKAAGEALSGVTFDRAYSSPMQRAQDTAMYILQESHNWPMEVNVKMGLRDVNWGALEKSSWEDARAQYGEGLNTDMVFGPRESWEFVSPVQDADTMFTYFHNYCMTIREILTECYTDGMQDENLLITGHAIVGEWLEYILPTTEIPPIDNAGITILHYDGGAWRLETLNNTDYEEVKEIVGTR